MPRVGPNASRLLLLAQKDAGKPLRDCVALCVSTTGLPSASEIPADNFVESPQILATVGKTTEIRIPSRIPGGNSCLVQILNQRIREYRC
jgi:hypothetical protein